MRSKFQTERRMRDAARGIAVEVPFDNALVKYLWVSERELRVEEISFLEPVKDRADEDLTGDPALGAMEDDDVGN